MDAQERQISNYKVLFQIVYLANPYRFELFLVTKTVHLTIRKFEWKLEETNGLSGQAIEQKLNRR